MFPRAPIDEEGVVSSASVMAMSAGGFSWVGLIVPGYPAAVIFVVFVRCSFSSNRPPSHRGPALLELMPLSALQRMMANFEHSDWVERHNWFERLWRPIRNPTHRRYSLRQLKRLRRSLAKATWSLGFLSATESLARLSDLVACPSQRPSRSLAHTACSPVVQAT